MIRCLKRRCQHLSSKVTDTLIHELSQMSSVHGMKGWNRLRLANRSNLEVWQEKCLVLAVECEHNSLLPAATLQLTVMFVCECASEMWDKGILEERESVLIGLRTSPHSVYLRTHIRPSFEATHNKFKLFPHTLVMGPVSFRSGRGLTEGMSRKDGVKEWGTLCFPVSPRSDPCWVDKEEACHRRRSKGPHSESKCAKETWESVSVTRRMVSGWRDLISNATVAIIELYTKGSAKKTC